MAVGVAWATFIAVGVGLALAWLALVALVLVGRSRVGGPTDLMRLLPDVVRLVKRLATDRSVPLTVRVRLYVLLAYLASPIDFIPDFLPVIGYADDVVLVTLTLRSVARSAGPGALQRHWPGTDAGLAALQRLAGLSPRG